MPSCLAEAYQSEKTQLAEGELLSILQEVRHFRHNRPGRLHGFQGFISWGFLGSWLWGLGFFRAFRLHKGFRGFSAVQDVVVCGAQLRSERRQLEVRYEVPLISCLLKASTEPFRHCCGNCTVSQIKCGGHVQS